MDLTSKAKRLFSPRTIDPTLPTQVSGQMDENDELLKTKTKRQKRTFTSACPRFKQFLKSYLPSSKPRCDAPTLPCKLRRSFTPAKKNENFQRKVDVSIWDEGRSQWSRVNTGVVLVDTQSKYNLITPQFLRHRANQNNPRKQY
ncbi:hypothetical protein J4E86_002068 [Alternaria arbusti]|uniref:uncharacterized protein n=1 Tax=Alternaria arbusti TaxID=232088 RepID=UPI00222058EB|nr:uncharacterized protein J4E86_002068 [Alternaria arbusti]KAI4960446.1 hypothetical protein J4E86_002068 [Alternaria arbusti]